MRTALDATIAEFYRHMSEDGIVPLDVMTRLAAAGILVDDLVVTNEDRMTDYNPDTWFNGGQHG